MQEELQAELDELTAIAKRIRRHEAAAQADRAEIRDRLPEIRAKYGPEAGPEVLEKAVLAVYVAATISRMTRHVAPPSWRDKPRRQVAA